MAKAIVRMATAGSDGWARVTIPSSRGLGAEAELLERPRYGRRCEGRRAGSALAVPGAPCVAHTSPPRPSGLVIDDDSVLGAPSSRAQAAY